MSNIVHCSTEEEYRRVQEQAFAEGKKWRGRSGATVDMLGWTSYGSKVCISIEEEGRLGYSDRKFFEEEGEGYAIIPASEYLNGIPSLERQVAAARQKLEEAEAKLKKATEIKAGDWVICVKIDSGLELGQLYKVTKDDDSDYGRQVVSVDGRLSPHYPEYFRKATPAEIAAHNNFKVTVDGTTYRADFTAPGLVNFGCADIDHEIFLALDKMLKSKTKSKGNRSITSVTIGKGVFTPELIDRIATHIKNLNTTSKAKLS